MRVLWISHSAGLGGAELALLEGTTMLTTGGHEVHVVVPAAGPLATRLAGRATVYVCNHHPWMAFQRTARTVGLWPLYNGLIATPRLVRLIHTVQPDVVLSNTLLTVVGALAARVAGVPHAWYAHEFGVEDHGLAFTLGAPLTRRFMRHTARACLTNSEVTSTKFARWLDLPAPVAPYLVPVAESDPVGRSSGERLKLVLVGSKKASKGQMDAVQAMVRLLRDGVDAELTLVGRDEGLEPELQRTVRREGIADRVRFLPLQPDPVAIMREADVVLMCSRMEAFGRVTVEALKAGRPVVGAAAGATPELVRHGENGYLYRPGNPGDLARWLAVCAQDRHALEVMGARGQEWACEQFGEKRCAAALQSALLAVIDTDPPSER
jgi:glycosyltransferase involved in cell wall biosynthesis